ncbi:uncharacterized protein LOC112003573 [Quercus suber]|uniref:uncharacterized protein LOC112003573 n=1 Tax=Quercus suber TaxID=58331 RepID=UPI0032DE8FF8
MASSSTNDVSNSNSKQSAPSFGTTMADESANNPYFLPATESPRIVLTSQPLTGPENYMSWVRSMFLALSARNKFGFVNGSIPEPESSSPLLNTIVFSWLTNSLSMDLKVSVMYINTAKDLWIDLRDRLSQGNTPRLLELQKEISHLSQGSLMVCSLILQEEKRSIGHGVNMVYSIEATAMYANNKRGHQGQNQGFHGGKGGNYKKEKPICTYCGLTSHIADKCYKLHGYPLGYKPKGGNKALASQVLAILPFANFGNLGGFTSANPNCFQNNGAFSSAFQNNGMLPGASSQVEIGYAP